MGGLWVIGLGCVVGVLNNGGGVRVCSSIGEAWARMLLQMAWIWGWEWVTTLTRPTPMALGMARGSGTDWVGQRMCLLHSANTLKR